MTDLNGRAGDLGDLIQAGQAFFNARLHFPFNPYKKLVGERIKAKATDGGSLADPMTVAYGYGPYIRHMRNEAEKSVDIPGHTTDNQILMSFLLELKNQDYAGWLTDDVVLPPEETLPVEPAGPDDLPPPADELRYATEAPKSRVASKVTHTREVVQANGRNVGIMLLGLVLLALLVWVVSYVDFSWHLFTSIPFLLILCCALIAALAFLLAKRAKYTVVAALLAACVIFGLSWMLLKNTRIGQPSTILATNTFGEDLEIEYDPPPGAVIPDSSAAHLNSMNKQLTDAVNAIKAGNELDARQTTALTDALAKVIALLEKNSQQQITVQVEQPKPIVVAPRVITKQPPKTRVRVTRRTHQTTGSRRGTCATVHSGGKFITSVCSGDPKSPTTQNENRR